MDDAYLNLVPVACLIDDDAECFLLDEVFECVEVANSLDEERFDLSAKDVCMELILSVCLPGAKVVELRDAFLLDVEDFKRVEVISPGRLLDNKALEVHGGFLLVGRGLELVDVVSPVCLLVTNGMIVKAPFLLDDKRRELGLVLRSLEDKKIEVGLSFLLNDESWRLLLILCSPNEDDKFGLPFIA